MAGVTGQLAPYASGSRARATARTSRAPKEAGWAPLWQNNASMRTSPQRKQDAVSISTKGLGQMLEQIDKTKEALRQGKQELTERTLDNGGDLENIREALAYYDEQIEALDLQAADLIARQTEQMSKSLAQKAEQAKNKDDQPPKTEQQIEQQQLSDLSDMASKVGAREVLARAKTQAERAGAVRGGELRTNGLRLELRYYRRKAEGCKPGPELNSLQKARAQVNTHQRENALKTYQAVQNVVGWSERVEQDEAKDETPPSAPAPAEQQGVMYE